MGHPERFNLSLGGDLEFLGEFHGEAFCFPAVPATFERMHFVDT